MNEYPSLSKLTEESYQVKLNDNYSLYLLRGTNVPIQSSNIIILPDNNGDFTLFDAGNNLSALETIAKSEEIPFNPKKITKIILSHAHMDHLYGIASLIEEYGINPEVYCSEIAKEKIEKKDLLHFHGGILGAGYIFGRLIKTQYSLCNLNQSVKKLSALEIKSLDDNEEVPIGEQNWKVIYSPGHSDDSICLYHNSGVLLSGDTLIGPNFKTLTNLHWGGKKKFMKTLDKLEKYQFSILLPGHSEPVEMNSKELLQSVRSLYR